MAPPLEENPSLRVRGEREAERCSGGAEMGAKREGLGAEAAAADL